MHNEAVTHPAAFLPENTMDFQDASAQPLKPMSKWAADINLMLEWE